MWKRGDESYIKKKSTPTPCTCYTFSHPNEKCELCMENGDNKYFHMTHKNDK
jgi:hypothetical protein